jgi:hypothetical protein
VKKVVIEGLVNIEDQQNLEARMSAFANETERIMLVQHSFKYLLSSNLLKLNKEFNFIVEAIELEKTYATSKKKRAGSAKRARSPKK